MRARPLSPRPLPPTAGVLHVCTHMQYIQIRLTVRRHVHKRKFVRNASSELLFPDPVLATATEEVDFCAVVDPGGWNRALVQSTHRRTHHISSTNTRNTTNHRGAINLDPLSLLPPTPLSWSGLIRAVHIGTLTEISFNWSHHRALLHLHLQQVTRHLPVSLNPPLARTRPADCRN